ncbi:MAG: hypothetical protein ACYS5F_13465 [Planctomycetota bacterium]|jgi:hypothetical protein
MFRKFVLLMFLFTFVATTAFAEDMRTPYWAGAPGSIYGVYTYEDDFPNGPGVGNQGGTHDAGTVFSGSCTDPVCDYPEIGAVVPHASNEYPPEWTYTYDTKGAHQHFIQTWVNEGVWHEEYEGRQGVMETWGSCWELKNFTGPGTKRVRIQITFFGGELEMWAIGQIYGENDPFTNPSDAWLDGWWDLWKIGLYDEEDPWYDTEGTIDLGDGWFHAAFEYDLIDTETEETVPNPGWEEFQFGNDGGNLFIDEVIIDTICYEGEEPPEGPGRPKPTQVSDPSPGNGETGVRCDVNEVSFFPPSEFLNRAAPIKDPNLQGPLDYYVYGDVCEVNVTDRIDLIATILNHDTNDSVTVETGFIAPGETYYWLVDVCDHNFDNTGEPNLLPGPLFTYQKWGFAINQYPPDGDDTVDPGQTLELVWQNDGYADTYKADLYDADGAWLQGTGAGASTAPNSLAVTVPLALGETYTWVVQECNDWQGSPLCVEGPAWSFMATLCETVDDFESYSTLEGTGNAWKDWWDDTDSDNAVVNGLQESLGTELDIDLVYQFDSPDSVKSMFLNVDRGFLDKPPSVEAYGDYTWFVPSDPNLARDGGKTVWVAYRASDTKPADPAKNEQMFMGFESSDSNTANIDYPGDVCDTEWSIFFVSLSEATDQGVDVTDIDEIRIGATGDETSGSFECYIDLLTRCGPVCPADYGYPDEVQGAFAPPYSILDSDLVFDCIVDEIDLEVIAGAWLMEDVLGVMPDDANLIVEYLFDVCAPFDDL